MAGIEIASDALRVTVNPRVGGTIVQVTHRETGLDVLGEVPWDPVDAPDLAGYLVYRSEAGAAPARITTSPVTDPFFNDTKVRVGARYHYTVRAVDRAGNESSSSPEAVAEPF